MTGEFHTHVHKALALKPSTVLKVLNRCDAWRKPERFEDLLIACTADARGRTGFEQSPYPQADFFRQALGAASAVDVQQIIAEGHQGKAIRDKLEQARIAAISRIKSDFQANA